MEKEELSILKKYWENSAFKVLLVLIFLGIISTPLGVYLEGVYPAQNAEEITSLSPGDTILPGTDVVDDSKIRRAPLITHPRYLIEFARDYRIMDLMESLLTGSIRTPIVHLTGGSISRYGIATGYEGPGMLVVNAGKLTVNPPDNFIWGFKNPYIYGYKTKNGLEISENNQTLRVVGGEDISNDTIPNQYISGEKVKEWYDKAQVGDKIVLDYALTNFNDGRNTVPPSRIVDYFGESVQEYIKDYPDGAPVMAYMQGYTTQKVSGSASYLGSFPEFNDYSRAHNAREFAEKWNGTIVPPQSLASGKKSGGFVAVRDPEAPGGFASHGTCPPARALRGAVTSAGVPLPVGLNWSFHCIAFGVDPSTGVKVNNTGEYPLLIVMWTAGAAGNTQIYAEVYELVPN